MLHIKNLRKKYGERIILDIEELRITSGISHLKGINGSGKTTFSKIIAGLIPFEGNIKLFDTWDPVRSKIKYRKLVNFAESEPNYPEFLTANDLINFIGKAKGTSPKNLAALPKTFGVDEYLFDHVGTYSSGMLKRLSLCLAFLGSPSLILLDEPFNALDTEAIQILKQKIEEHHEQSVNFILVSHMEVEKFGINIHSSYLADNHTIKPE